MISDKNLMLTKGGETCHSFCEILVCRHLRQYQKYEITENEYQEPLEVVHAKTIINERTVMIKHLGAFIAELTMK